MDDETDNLQNMGYLQDIISYIFDEKKIVTYKWISNTLNIHVNRAKQLLYTFIKHLPAERLEELKVTYLVGGILQDNRGCRIQVVSEEDLTKVKENFKVITSEHVYSVSLKHCLSDLHDLYSVDGVKSNEISKHGALRCQQSLVKDPEKVATKRKNVEVSSVADKKLPVGSKQDEKSNTVKTGEKRKANGISAMFSAASNKKKTEETIEPRKPDDNSKQENTSAVDKKAPSAKAAPKGGGRLAAMFSAQASKPKPVQNNTKDVKTKEEKDTKEKQAKEEVSLKTEKVSPKCLAKDDKKSLERKSIDEKSPKAQNKKSQNSKAKQKKRKASEKDNDKNKKRKRIVVMDDSDSSEDDVFGSAEEDDVDQGRCPSPTTVDVEDDEPVKEEPKEQEQPTKKGRARKRVEVNKTFMDEDGYIVSKKVVEFVSCSEDEDEKENEKGEDKPNKGAQKLQKSSPSKKSPEKKKQATLMSFFKRN